MLRKDVTRDRSTPQVIHYYYPNTFVGKKKKENHYSLFTCLLSWKESTNEKTHTVRNIDHGTSYRIPSGLKIEFENLFIKIYFRNLFLL